jgi:hypothetical protein
MLAINESICERGEFIDCSARNKCPFENMLLKLCTKADSYSSDRTEVEIIKQKVEHIFVALPYSQAASYMQPGVFVRIEI